jgi:hypothetical protein
VAQGPAFGHDGLMTAKDAWKEVGDRLSALGLKLKLHTEEERADRDEDGADAMARVKAALEDVMEALGDASRDPAVRADVRSVVDALGDAANATADEVRQALLRERGERGERD